MRHGSELRGSRYDSSVDTIIFALIALAGGAAILARRRWLVVISWALAFVMVALLLNHHVLTAAGQGPS